MSEVKVPKLSEDFESGTLVAWHKAVGDPVKQNEVIAEIMTDKVNVEVESPYAGTVQALLIEEDETAAYDQTIALIE
jgi:pyruvate/2-oxoglutarate dehydrogenase complex dihydrolipoamide acyltransferase (E2) component